MIRTNRRQKQRHVYLQTSKTNKNDEKDDNEYQTKTRSEHVMFMHDIKIGDVKQEISGNFDNDE